MTYGTTLPRLLARALSLLALGACSDGEESHAGSSQGGAGSHSAHGGSTGASPDGSVGSVGTPPDPTQPEERPDPVPYEPECASLPSTQVIANWDVVPHQRLDGPFEVGVVGFHEEGLDVLFQVEGKEIARVENPTYNPRTGVYEYWFTLDPSDFDDGEVVVKATATPDCPGHEARELGALPLLANSGGSLRNDTIIWADCSKGSDETGDGTQGNPVASIEKALSQVGGGGTVHLAAATCYELTSLLPTENFQQWTTVRPAPGVERTEVQIRASSDTSETSTGRFFQDFIRWQEVGLFSDSEPGFSTVFYFESGDRVWFDRAEIYEANGRYAGTNPWGGNDGYKIYLTGTHLHDLSNGGFGFGRDVTVSNIASDVFRASSNLFAVNLTVRGVDKGESEAHPDFFQLYAPDGSPENMIIYNAEVYDMGAQGIFGGPGELKDAAVVNLLMEKDPADSNLMSQLSGSWSHVLLWHLTTVDSSFFIREPTDLDDFFIHDGSFHSLHAGEAAAIDGFTISHNHFAGLNWNQTNGPLGTNSSEGDPKYRDVAMDDYRPASDSPLCGAGVPLPGVPADARGELYSPDAPAIGAFACQD